jgi:hypothetical protein
MSKSKKRPPQFLSAFEKQQIIFLGDKLVAEMMSYTPEQAQLYAAFFKEALRQNSTGELITHQSGDWVDTIMNFRDGATTVIGTLCECIAHLHFLRKGRTVEPLYERLYQMTDRDFLVDGKYYVSVKKYSGTVKMRLGDDYFIRNCPSLTHITFVQLEHLKCYTFDVAPLRQFFNDRRNPYNDNGYIYENVAIMPPHTSL